MRVGGGVCAFQKTVFVNECVGVCPVRVCAGG